MSNDFQDRASLQRELARVQEERDALVKRAESAERERDFWKLQMECSAPAVDAIRKLQAVLCPRVPNSVQDVPAVLDAVRRLGVPL